MYGNAIAYYDKVIDYLNKTKTERKVSITFLNKTDQEILVEAYQDKSKIELRRGNHDKAVDIIREAIKLCEEKYEKFVNSFVNYSSIEDYIKLKNCALKYLEFLFLKVD